MFVKAMDLAHLGLAIDKNVRIRILEVSSEEWREFVETVYCGEVRKVIGNEENKARICLESVRREILMN